MFKFKTIGSDPEFFIKDSNNSIKSSIGLIQGTKDDPEDMGEGYAVLKDNVLIEGNIPPSDNKNDFVAAFMNLKQLMNDILCNFGMELHSSDSEEIEAKDLLHREANVFGCSGYNLAWHKKSNVRAEDMSDCGFRVAGCHIHIGYEMTKESNYSRNFINEQITKAFDLFVTIPFRKLHNDERRNSHYGTLGAFRNTPYGLECRSLGGYFTQDKFLPIIYDRVEAAMKFAANEENFKKLAKLTEVDLENLDELYKKLKIERNSLCVE